MKNLKLILALLMVFSVPVYSAGVDMSGYSNTKLLELYWDCVDLAKESSKTGYTIDKPSMIICSQVSSEVRMRFFNDDFGPYLKWTNENQNRSVKLLPK